ncbi:hypothetical protein PR003_g19670 [Phytophthora rubi]|uniref:Uncharacterized protein n=1 Tax=Phytophthora rubi TaxID=129364 RepID=A0A6A4DVK7_9STRA|nr:hypothetical protein PR002_g19232 [Phytophthora rubi]KAE9000079.1 hypothetical protein PR001_g18883 [Phytophthora rubi]KAE9312831.1 hypothetical protein PR003_g19670 [Phytophthora rubi]
MCDVLQQLQPAGAFLRQAQNLQPAGAFLNPIAVVGSCSDIDEALRLCDEGDGDQMERGHQQDEAEPVDFLASIRRGLDELVAASEADDEDSDEEEEEDDSDDEGCYYQVSKENTYYSPDQKLPGGFLEDDALDLSDTSTASSSLLTAWAQPESEEEEDADQEDLIFQLEM